MFLGLYNIDDEPEDIVENLAPGENILSADVYDPQAENRNGNS